MKGRKVVSTVIYHIFIAALGLVMVYPVLWMVSGSLKNNAEILSGSLSLIPPAWRWENFAQGWRGFGHVTFTTYFKNSLLITTFATLGTVISSSLIAYALSRLKFAGRKLWFTIMIGTMLLPGQVVMIPQYLIYNRIHWVGTPLPLIVPHFFGAPFFIYMMMQFMTSIPRELDEAAIIDGCSKYSVFSRVIFPLLKPSLISTIIIQFYWKWDDYMGPMLYLGKPTSYTVSIAVKLFADATSKTDYGPMFAMSTLSMIPVFTIFLVFNRYLVDGISTSGLKG
ncbi:MAG: carbohydrate ABC transporter permease [Lachnospiraceae bacterium]|nr:carbohydrate ABC transporter permease [Lachnospiraceae bacterium]